MSFKQLSQAQINSQRMIHESGQINHPGMPATLSVGREMDPHCFFRDEFSDLVRGGVAKKTTALTAPETNCSFSSHQNSAEVLFAFVTFFIHPKKSLPAREMLCRAQILPGFEGIPKLESFTMFWKESHGAK